MLERIPPVLGQLVQGKWGTRSIITYLRYPCTMFEEVGAFSVDIRGVASWRIDGPPGVGVAYVQSVAILGGTSI